MRWQELAACRPTGDPVRDELVDRIMYPENGAASNDRTVRHLAHQEGVAFCQGCPVIAECLTDALRMEGGGGSGRWGVRGGTTPDQRAEMYRRRRRPVTQ